MMQFEVPERAMVDGEDLPYPVFFQVWNNTYKERRGGETGVFSRAILPTSCPLCEAPKRCAQEE